MPKAGKRPRYIGTMKIKSRRIQQNPKFHTPHHQASAGKPPERREPGPIGINNAYKVPTCLSISTTERRKRCESRLMDEIWSYYEMCLSTTSQVMPIILGTLAF